MPSDTIALIDDDAAVLDSLRMVLTDRGIPAECFSSAEEFVAGAGQLSPACIVSDVRMPGLSGLELQNELRTRAVAAPLILITGHGDIAMAVRAIKAGAFDFIEKPFDNEVLLDAIRRAVASRAREQTQQGRNDDWAARARELSLRQRQVMGLVAEGLPNKEIALKLGLSPRTVENYRASVMEKMGAKNLADLVRMVVVLEPGLLRIRLNRQRCPDLFFGCWAKHCRRGADKRSWPLSLSEIESVWLGGENRATVR